VFELPGGRMLVGGAGLAVVALGVWLVVRGIRYKFEKHLDTSSMPQGLHKVARIGGILGHVARGVVAGLAGLLLVKAALDYDPQQAKGVDGTLRTIAEQPYGKVLLLLAAAGLAAFGLYSLVESRYRRL
jgi:cytochrome bd-type quinol oxidase subunit 2